MNAPQFCICETIEQALAVRGNEPLHHAEADLGNASWGVHFWTSLDLVEGNSPLGIRRVSHAFIKLELEPARSLPTTEPPAGVVVLLGSRFLSHTTTRS